MRQSLLFPSNTFANCGGTVLGIIFWISGIDVNSQYPDFVMSETKSAIAPVRNNDVAIADLRMINQSAL